MIITSRSKSEVWLLCQANKEILGCCLPTKLSIMKKYFFYQKQKNLRQRKFLNLSLNAMMIFKKKARITIMRQDNVI